MYFIEKTIKYFRKEKARGRRLPSTTAAYEFDPNEEPLDKDLLRKLLPKPSQREIFEELSGISLEENVAQEHEKRRLPKSTQVIPFDPNEDLYSDR